MSAHRARRTSHVGRIAGRGALTAATALALTGGTASLAFAGEAPADTSTDHESNAKSHGSEGHHEGHGKDCGCAEGAKGAGHQADKAKGAADDVWHGVQDEVEDSKHKVQDAAADGEHKVKDKIEDGQHKVEGAKHKIKDAAEDGQHKIEDAKAKADEAGHEGAKSWKHVKGEHHEGHGHRGQDCDDAGHGKKHHEDHGKHDQGHAGVAKSSILSFA